MGAPAPADGRNVANGEPHCPQASNRERLGSRLNDGHVVAEKCVRFLFCNGARRSGQPQQQGCPARQHENDDAAASGGERNTNAAHRNDFGPWRKRYAAAQVIVFQVAKQTDREQARRQRNDGGGCGEDDELCHALAYAELYKTHRCAAGGVRWYGC